MVVKRSFLLSVLISALAAYHFIGIQSVQAAQTALDVQSVKFVEVASGLNQPLFLTHAGDGSGRLFIIQRTGQILIYRHGALLPTPFLNIQSIVNSSGGEQGLLALAFHPSYETNGRFYTVHTDSNKSIVLSVFTRSSASPDQADPNSRVTLLTIPKPYTNHNGGTLAFGPDGYLYWSTGDGGSGGDPDNNAQNLNSLLGKILRLDVNSPASYSVPPGNPFSAKPGSSIRKEIWAYGLRNPWRFSFDRSTGDMYVGDVGQNKREEINFQLASSKGGENYGWRIMEGSVCYNPATGCNQSGKILPIAEYDHTKGCSVTGGNVYRGSQYPQLDGYYFYGDFCSGLLYALYNDPQNGWTSLFIRDTPYSISSFGEDEQGELYMTDYSSGKIYQVIYVRPPAQATLISPSGTITDIQPNFSWNEVPETAEADAATWYYLWVNGPSGNVIKQWYEASDICNGAVCSITSPIALLGGAYTWWIQTWNDGGVGPWSDGMDFNIPLAGKAILVSPNATITDHTPTYNWDEVSDATWYYLWVNGPSGAVIKRWYEAVDICSSGTCSIEDPTILNSGIHTWWIQTWNNAGLGPWSDGMTFHIPAPPLPGKANLDSPTANIGTNNPTYTWNEVAGSTWYFLWVNGSNGNVHKQWYTSAEANCDGTICSVTPTTTLSSGAHTWWIQTWNEAGFGPWSTSLSFSIP